MRIRQSWLYLPPREMAKIYLSKKIFFLSKFKDMNVSFRDALGTSFHVLKF